MPGSAGAADRKHAPPATGAYDRRVTRCAQLVAVSLASLGANVAGMAVALRRRHPCDVPLVHGRRESIERDSLLIGTALSAPVLLLAVHVVATAVVATRWRPAASAVLAAVGGTYVPGYLAERLVRARLRPRGWDRVESPIALAGPALAVTMAALGRTCARRAPAADA